MSDISPKKYILIILTALVPFFCSAEVGNSGIDSERVGLSVDQTVFSFDLAPGASQEFKINVENISENVQKMSAEPGDISIGDNNDISFLAGENELYGMKDWMSINEADWELGARGNKEINLIITVPQDATVGSHYSILSVRAYPEITGNNFQSTIVSGRIGVYVMVNVLGEVSGKGEINDFKAPIISSNKINFNAEFENTGNVHYIPHGEVHIKNLINRKDSAIDLEKHFVFPGKKYNFETNWDSGSVFGVYKARASFVDGDGKAHFSERFIFGKLFFLIPLAMIVLFIISIKIRKKKSV